MGHVMFSWTLCLISCLLLPVLLNELQTLQFNCLVHSVTNTKWGKYATMAFCLQIISHNFTFYLQTLVDSIENRHISRRVNGWSRSSFKENRRSLIHTEVITCDNYIVFFYLTFKHCSELLFDFLNTHPFIIWPASKGKCCSCLLESSGIVVLWFCQFATIVGQIY